MMKNKTKQKIKSTYVPLRKLIFEDNKKEVDIVNHFTDYSPVLARIELRLYHFIKANPETEDQDALKALKEIREDPLHEFCCSDDEALEFAIVHAISQGLQQKRLALNEVKALLDWLIHEVEGRIKKNESYLVWLDGFFEDNKKGFLHKNKNAT